MEGTDALAAHLVTQAGESDVDHVMWLNRNVTKHRVSAGDLAVLLRRRSCGSDTGMDRVGR